MIYFYLVLLAAIFGVLGFLFRAFCFPVDSDLKARQKIESLQRELKQRQTELRDAREKITKTTTSVRSLEQQIKQRNEDMEKFRKMASKQDEEIAALQKEAATIRAALAAAKKGHDTSAKAESAAPSPRTGAAPMPAQEPKVAPQAAGDKSEQKLLPSTAQSGAAAPVWRENLNNVVGILNEMEKEIKK